MRHFIQVHNPDRMRPYNQFKKAFRIVTNKPVEGLIGETIWLVTGTGRPRDYYLCSRFVVDRIGHQDSGAFRNYASGSKGQNFAPQVKIDEQDWFPGLLKKCARFSLGLQRIKSEAIIRGLQKISSS